MKDAILLELVRRWNADAEPPRGEQPALAHAPGTNAELVEAVYSAKAEAERATKRECADTLRMLVTMLGER